MIALLGAVVAIVTGASRIAEQAQTATPAGANPAATRACSANPVLSDSAGKKKAAHKLHHPLPPDAPPRCVEVKGQELEVQEFLQNVVRERAWKVAANRASEDTWSFVCYLSPIELEQFADTKVLLEPVEFSDGKAAVVVRTSDLADGYVRVQISAHFQGEGKSTDQATPQPTTSWTMNTKGALEQELVKALQTSYKPLQ